MITSRLDAHLAPWLTEHGFPADAVNANDKHGLTPLMRAARQGDNDIVTALLRCGAQLETRNTDGNNALWFACVGEHLPTMELLIRLGIDINNQNDNGATCLMYASSTEKFAALQTLLQAGADTQCKSMDDFTALDVAATVDCLTVLRGRVAMLGS